MHLRSKSRNPSVEALERLAAPAPIMPMTVARLSAVEVRPAIPIVTTRAGLIVPDRLLDALRSQNEVRGILLDPSRPVPVPGWVDPSPIAVLAAH